MAIEPSTADFEEILRRSGEAGEAFLKINTPEQPAHEQHPEQSISHERTHDEAFLETSRVMGDIDNAKTPQDLQGVLAEISRLIGQLPAGSPHRMTLEALNQRAQGRAVELASESESDHAQSVAAGASSKSGCLPKTEFERAAYQYMTNEKAFFDAIDPDKDYKSVAVGDDGKVVVGSDTTVKGQDVREAVATISFHRKDAAKQEAILEEAGTDAEGKKPDGKRDRQEEMEKLKDSLDTVEGYTAGQVLENRSLSRQQQEGIIANNHAHIHKAKQKAEEVAELDRQAERVRDAADVLPGAEAAAMALDKEREKKEKELQQSLTEVSDKVMRNEPSVLNVAKEQDITQRFETAEATVAPDRATASIPNQGGGAQQIAI